MAACDDGYIGTATVIDFFRSDVAKQVKAWLAFLGFKLWRCEVHRALQFSNTCAFVSADVASRQGTAADWANVADAADAAGATVWQRGYDEVLKIPRAPHTFRTDDEIQQLLREWDTNPGKLAPVQTFSLDLAMSEIAKCVRALAYHNGIITDKSFPGDGHRGADNLISDVLDETLTFPRRYIVNTQPSSKRGMHWFNVAFSVKFKDE